MVIENEIVELLVSTNHLAQISSLSCTPIIEEMGLMLDLGQEGAKIQQRATS
jgi:hypothetical protein